MVFHILITSSRGFTCVFAVPQLKTLLKPQAIVRCLTRDFQFTRFRCDVNPETRLAGLHLWCHDHDRKLKDLVFFDSEDHLVQYTKRVNSHSLILRFKIMYRNSPKNCLLRDDAHKMYNMRMHSFHCHAIITSCLRHVTSCHNAHIRLSSWRWVVRCSRLSNLIQTV